MSRVFTKDRIGEKIGFVTIIGCGFREYENRKRRSTVIFKCECGNIKEVLTHNLTSGKTKSCGCKSIELKTAHLYKHGMWKERIYKTYVDMKQRCLNSNNKRYHRYGGRGIKICDEWLSDFMNFYNWAMKNGYEEHLTIERINNDGDYDPSNCTWITLSEQCKNRNNSNGRGKNK